jgi:hypothetical protein
MFQLADPTQDATYLNRAKYTEAFIAQNILNLPEYASSADTHFDSVRPINHAYVIPQTYTQRTSTNGLPTTAPGATGAGSTTKQVGADATQTSVWALK